MSELYPNLTKKNLELAQKVLQELFIVNDFRRKDAVEAEGIKVYHETTQAIQESLEAIVFELETVSSQEFEEDSDIVLMSDVMSEVNKNFRKGVYNGYKD